MTDFPSLEDLFENAPCGHVVADASGRITKINGVMAAWTGYDTKTFIGQRFTDLLTIAGKIYFETHLAPLLHMQGSVSEIALDLNHADGTSLPVLVNAAEGRTPQGTPYTQFSLFKATHRRHYERELLTARRSAEAASASLHDMNETLATRVEERTRERDRAWRLSHDLLAIVDEGGTLIAVNSAWQAVLAWEEHELVGTNLTALTHSEDLQATVQALSQITNWSLTGPYDHQLRHKDGSYRWFSWTGTFEDDRIYLSGRHTTLERHQREVLAQAEEALRQAQKLEAVGQLTGGVAHDFNNLLTIIKSSTDLLRRPGLADDRRRRYVDAISDTVDRASKLTGQLLAFARRQALKPEVFDVTERVRSISDMLGAVVGSRIEIVLELSHEPCFANADASQFETALVNMVVNARDAMDGEGQVTIKVEAGGPSLPIRSETGPARHVVVSIADTGTGIPVDQLTQIFEPFFTTKEVGKGTGLGLSQVYGFAKQSGGDVAVESEMGRGTTFMLYLPQAERQPVDDNPSFPETPGIKDGHGRRVLVVEDNAEVGAFSTQLLQDLGYETTWAANGAEALSCLDRGHLFDVVFSDVLMPGMSGVDLGREIRRRYPRLPVVLTSGYSHVLAQDSWYGFSLLQKPYAAEELSRTLQRAIAGGPR